MLNFDTNHNFAAGNLNEKKGKKILKNTIIGGLIITNILSFSGCAKNVPCDIQGNHAHYYINDEYIGRYIVSEKSSISGLNRLDNYIFVDEKEEGLLEFINENDLFKIDDNKNAINNITDNQMDYKEYRYSYYYTMSMPVLHTNGKNTYVTCNYIPTIGYSWTSNPNKENLTGEERDCHYVYYGYKIIKNDNGDYELVKSKPVDSITELPEGYDYIKGKFYDVVNLYDRNEILDYEDGPEEGKVIISEDEYNQSQTQLESQSKSK